MPYGTRKATVAASGLPPVVGGAESGREPEPAGRAPPHPVAGGAGGGGESRADLGADARGCLCNIATPLGRLVPAEAATH